MLLAFSLIFLKILSVAESLFDFDELKNTNYGIEILQTPITLSNDETIQDPTALLVTSIHGQSYQCSYLDKLEQDDKNKAKEEEAFETGIVELLRPIADGPCLHYTKGWWTYELCYSSTIKQFHMDDGRVAGAVTDIGLHESDFDWSIDDNIKARKTKRFRYHSQQYTNGSLCDITNKPRRAEVRFTCEIGASDYMNSVEESETCVYVINVMTSRVCFHPYLKPLVAKHPLPITCNPLLSADDYLEYMEMLNDEEQKKAEKQIKAEIKSRDKEFVLKHGKLIEKERRRTFSEIAADIDGTELSQMMSSALQKALADVMTGDYTELADDAAAAAAADIQMEVHVFDDETNIEESVTEIMKKYRTMSQKETAAEAQKTENGDDTQDDIGDDDDVTADDIDDIDEDDDGHVDFDDDLEMLEEFDRALDKMSNREILSKYRANIENAITEQLDEIINEAEEELALNEAELDDLELDQTQSLRSLSKSLTLLMDRLEKAEKNYDHADSLLSETIDKYQTRIDKLKDELENEDDFEDELANGYDEYFENEESQLLKEALKTAKDVHVSGVLFSNKRADDNGGDKNKERPSTNENLNKGPSTNENLKEGTTAESNNLEDKGPSTKNEDQKAKPSAIFDNIQFVKKGPSKKATDKKIEQNTDKGKVSTQLHGQNIEIKVITTGYIDKDGSMHILDDDDDDTDVDIEVSKVLFAILGHGGEQKQETERQQELEDGYKFSWNNNNNNKNDNKKQKNTKIEN